ncbi:hypothetical protein BH10PSE12_BH10PSE12_08470 [soil metagenome]
MIPRRLPDISVADFEALVRSEVAECPALKFKHQLPGDKKHRRFQNLVT